MAWTKGKSGNPAGRPKGVGEPAQLRARLKMPLMLELIDRMTLQALAGDTTAQRLLLDRVFPTLKPQAAEVSLEFAEGSSLLARGESIVQAIADGRIPPDVGSQLVAALGALGALRQVEELEARIRALENPDGCEFA